MSRLSFLLISFCLIVLLNLLSCNNGLNWRTNSLINISKTAEEKIVCIDIPKEKHRKEIVRALDVWNISLKNWIKFQPTTELYSCDYLITEFNEEMSDMPEALAFVPSVGSKVIYLIKGKYEFDPYGITMHEIGHTLGAQHMLGTLMNDIYDKELYKCPDSTTIAQVAAWNRIPLKNLTWCL